jgi:hypothetical protein
MVELHLYPPYALRASCLTEHRENFARFYSLVQKGTVAVCISLRDSNKCSRNLSCASGTDVAPRRIFWACLLRLVDEHGFGRQSSEACGQVTDRAVYLVPTPYRLAGGHYIFKKDITASISMLNNQFWSICS